jgi:hypothetical protein
MDLTELSQFNTRPSNLINLSTLLPRIWTMYIHLEPITVEILQRDDEDIRHETFGIQLSNVTPDGAKLSKKNFNLINIVTDAESKKK